MTLLRKLWTSHSKYGVALLGVLTQAVSLGMLHGNLLRAAQLGIALLTAEGVRLVTNSDPTAPPPAPVEVPATDTAGAQD